uniref:Ig-like domain-containing protein n=1 Tax=Hucho hucho TaxID=62062 RepID=A0A4W5RDF0_9TELE
SLSPSLCLSFFLSLCGFQQDVSVMSVRSITYSILALQVNINYMIWYKLTTGMVLQYITKSSKYQSDDIGNYFCGKIILNHMLFADGIFTTSKRKTVKQQPVSESVQPGGSVTLNWTTHTETFAGEHSVYWFRHGSGESRPGIINTHGDRSDQCEKSPETGSPTQSCVYNLPKRNLSLSDAGTYYCAVASCGEIRFGNWTKLDIQEHDSPFDLSPTFLALVVSIIVLGIVTLLLVWALCKTLNRDSRGITLFLMYPIDVLNYAAVSFTPKKNSSSRRAREKTSREDAVYSEVRYLQQQ